MAAEVFALKGGAAMNQFEGALPQLSFDIDLTYLSIEDRAQSVGVGSDKGRHRAAPASNPGHDDAAGPLRKDWQNLAIMGSLGQPPRTGAIMQPTPSRSPKHCLPQASQHFLRGGSRSSDGQFWPS